jgi:hypothetical protein
MSAIITDNFRRNSAKLFLNDIAGLDSRGGAIISTNVNRYYLGIGKSDKWPNAGAVTEDASGYNVAAPVGSFSDALEVLNNVATFSKLGASNTTLLIPNVPWASGNKYKAYNSYDSSCFYATGDFLPCYATTTTGMYLCLSNNAGGTSTVAPTDTSLYTPDQKGDSYVWIFVQPVSQLGSAFITDQFIEVSQTALTGANLTLSSTAQGGLCSPVFHVVNPGSGYTSAPTVKLRGSDGAGSATYDITLTATVAGGVITGVVHSLALANWPKGLQVASVEITGGGGTGAIVVPVIAPRLGYAHIPAAVMPSWYAGVSVDLADGISSDNFYTPYRQVSIVRNPNTTATTANALRSLTLSGTAPTVDINNTTLIYDTTDRPLAVADAISVGKLYFHQNYTSGFSEIPASGSFRLAVGGTNYIYSAVTASECNEAVLANGSISGGDGVYARTAGEVVFVENRKKITRSAGQTEKIKIIIQF